MEHIKLTTSDLEAIEKWIAHGVYLFPYYPDTKTPCVRWTEDYFENVADVELASKEGANIAFDILTANAIMVDIDRLEPMLQKDFDAKLASARENGCTDSHNKFMDYYARNYLKPKWKSRGIDECQRMLDSLRSKIMLEFPSHYDCRSGSGFGHHFYYHRRELADSDVTHYGSHFIEIFANRHPAYPVDWSSLRDFHDHEPVPLTDVVAYWKPLDDMLAQVKRKRFDMQMPSFKRQSTVKHKVTITELLDRWGVPMSPTNERLFNHALMAGKRNDPGELQIAIDVARATEKDMRRIHRTAQSGWNIGQRKQFSD